MLRRRFVVPMLLVLAVLGIGGIAYSQLESADRGILPLDSSGTLEISGIHVDVGGEDAMSARYAGWKIAQRQGFKALWAKMHNAPISQAPNIPDSTLDDIVTSINVEREQIGPNRYIADLGVLFDRARAATFLGVEGGEVRRSVPMLLIPVTVTAGTETSVELKNAWQRAWAQFRTSQSPIDYVRISGLGVDPMLVNAAQTERPGRGWWRNIIDLYGAADVLVAEVQLQRSYPGGPAKATFIAHHGPDNEVVGGFTLTSQSGNVAALMAEGARRTDILFSNALAAGKLVRDSSLDLPAPPPLPVEEKPIETKAAAATTALQIQIDSGGDVNVYNFGMAHLRTMGGITSATPQLINPTGTSYVLVNYAGSINQLAAALGARGWAVSASGSVVKIKSASGKPPPLPPPPSATPPAQPAPAKTPAAAPAQPRGQGAGR
jgi:hypothetical protein